MSNLIQPNATESFGLPSGKHVSIPKCNISFQPWEGKAVSDSYGNKTVIDYKGRPLFAELVVLNFLQENGWGGVWVDTYGRRFRKKMPGTNSKPYKLPEKPLNFFNAVSEKTGPKGCWDVFAWKNNEFLFSECKRKNKDRVRETQLLWLQTCLDQGLNPDNFLLIEWNLERY